MDAHQLVSPPDIGLRGRTGSDLFELSHQTAPMSARLTDAPSASLVRPRRGTIATIGEASSGRDGDGHDDRFGGVTAGVRSLSNAVGGQRGDGRIGLSSTTGSLHKPDKEWVRRTGTRLELRVKLTGNEEGMLGIFNHFHEATIR